MSKNIRIFNPSKLFFCSHLEDLSAPFVFNFSFKNKSGLLHFLICPAYSLTDRRCLINIYFMTIKSIQSICPKSLPKKNDWFHLQSRFHDWALQKCFILIELIHSFSYSMFSCKKRISDGLESCKSK